MRKNKGNFNKKKVYGYIKKSNNYEQVNCSIFTIGYGGRYDDHIQAIVSSLRENKVNILVDVRINPYCSFDDRLSKAKIGGLLQKERINYVHAPELGNIFRDFDNGEKKYEDLFQRSGYLITERLRQLCQTKGNNVCLMCSCGNVKLCHRNVISGFLRVEYGYKVVNLKPKDVRSNVFRGNNYNNY